MDIDKLIKKVSRSRHCLQFSKDTQKYEVLEGLNEFLSKKVEPRLLIVLKQIT